MHARPTAALALAFFLAATPAARAQSPSDAAAEAVFEQGVAKMESGDFAAACPLLARAVELSRGEALGGMLALADCYDKTQRPASAWALYKRVAARAAATGETVRAETARTSAERVAPAVPRVVLRAPAGAPAGLVAVRGEDRIPADVWSVPVPVDPGQATFRFEAPGFLPAEKTVEIATGASIEVEAPVLAPKTVTTGGDTVAPPPPDEEGGGIGGLGIAGIVVGGLGIVSLGTGIGVAVAAKSSWSDAVDTDCGGNLDRCRDLTGIDDARAQGDVGTALFAVGAGLTAVGVTLLVVDLATGAPPSARDTARTSFSFAVAPAGVRATWSFR